MSWAGSCEAVLRMKESPPSAAEAVKKERRGDWLVVVLLLAVLAIECSWAAARHRSVVELRAAAASGPSVQRTWAFHILLNRDDPPNLGDGFVASMLASPEAAVRELAMTSDVWRLRGKEEQLRYLATLHDQREAIRSRYYLLELGRPVTRAALRAYFGSAG